jgi:hypothetical protein
MRISTPEKVVISSPVNQQSIPAGTQVQLVGYVVLQMGGVSPEAGPPLGLTGQSSAYPASLMPDTTPNPLDQNPWAHWRNPMDMIRQGWSKSLFQA